MFPFIALAYADTEAAAVPATTSIVAQLLMLGGFVLIFWLLIWRPQNKRAKAHRELINNLSKGDEVLTSGGILGKVSKVSDDYVTLQVNADMELNFQRVSVASILPKGTIKELK